MTQCRASFPSANGCHDWHCMARTIAGKDFRRGFRFRVSGFRVGVYGSGFRVGVYGSGFRVGV